MRLRSTLLLIAIFLLTSAIIHAQNTVTVPDITGLSVPEAAAELNAVGIGIGLEEAILATAETQDQINRISTQSVPAGTDVASGTRIDIGVVRTNNVYLIYDDNDITLVNTTNNVADVTSLRFVAIEGDNPASFSASRWGSNVRENRCLQLWSIVVRDNKPISGCEDIQWLTTNATGEHFWTAANSVVTFSVVEDGVERTQCPAASVGSQDAPVRCDFYLDGAGSANDITQYTYFVYTTDAIIIYNPTPNLWMPTDRTTIFNMNPNSTPSEVSFVMGNPDLFGSPDIVADVALLAPQQCIMLTNGDNSAAPPQDCNVIAQASMPQGTGFWLADFEIDSATDRPQHMCPAAVATQPTVCIVPQ